MQRYSAEMGRGILDEVTKRLGKESYVLKWGVGLFCVDQIRSFYVLHEKYQFSVCGGRGEVYSGLVRSEVIISVGRGSDVQHKIPPLCGILTSPHCITVCKRLNDLSVHL